MRHSESEAMWEEAIVRPREVGSLRKGTRVAKSRFRRRRSEFEGLCDQGTLCLRKYTCCLTVISRAMGVEVSNHDVVITEVKKKVKVWCEIGGTSGYCGDVNVMMEC